MRFSAFGEKFVRECGILQLMDDLGHALAEGGDDVIMLGGGNPSRIPAVEACLRQRMESLLGQEGAFERLIGNYAPRPGIAPSAAPWPSYCAASSTGRSPRTTSP